MTDDQLTEIVDGWSKLAQGDCPSWSELELVTAQAREANALRQALDEATGPHCPNCGNAIDPDCCWCGDGPADKHYDETHGFIPMGCDCCRGERDWKKAASNLREQLWNQRQEANALRSQLASAQQLIQLFGNQLAAMNAVVLAAESTADNLRKIAPVFPTDAESLPIVQAIEAFLHWKASHPHADFQGTVTVGGHGHRRRIGREVVSEPLCLNCRKPRAEHDRGNGDAPWFCTRSFWSDKHWLDGTVIEERTAEQIASWLEIGEYAIDEERAEAIRRGDWRKS